MNFKYISALILTLFITACDGKNEQDNSNDAIMQKQAEALDKAKGVEDTLIQANQDRHDKEDL